MDSYASEAKFLESLPRPQYHATLRDLMVHCGQFSGSEKLFHLAQNLLQNLGEYKGPQYESVVRACTERLRLLPDPEGHIKDYANHVEQCCLDY